MVLGIDSSKPGAVIVVDDEKTSSEIKEATRDMLHNLTRGALAGATKTHRTFGDVGRK